MKIVRGIEQQQSLFCLRLNTNRRIAHAPVEPTISEAQHVVKDIRKKKRIKPELVVATTHLGIFGGLNPIRATPGEHLPKCQYCSQTRLLLRIGPADITLNSTNVWKEIDHFSKRAIIAYFVE